MYNLAPLRYIHARIALVLLIGLPLSIGTQACKCDSKESPSAGAESGIDVAPLDSTARIQADPLLLRAVDATRAIAVTRSDTGEPLVVTLVENGKLRWSRPLPCDPARAGVLDGSGDKDLVTVRCPVGAEPGSVGTIALATTNGELRWAATSGSAQSLAPDSLRVFQVADRVVGIGGPAGVEALETTNGSQVWARRDATKYVDLEGDLLLVQEESGDVLLDASTGTVVRKLPDRPLGILGDGVCVLGRRGIEWLGRRATRTLVSASALTKVVDAGMQPDSRGLRVACGRRGSSTVVLADADSHNLVAVIGRGGRAKVVRLPATSGPPVIQGWEHELPRYVPIAVKPRSLVIVDLDEARVAWTIDVPFPRNVESAGEMLLVRGRSGNHFLLSNDWHLLAIDGDSGDISADERKLAQTFWWLDLPRAIAGDVVWSARVEHGKTKIEPARFTKSAAMAVDWTQRRQVAPQE